MWRYAAEAVSQYNLNRRMTMRTIQDMVQQEIHLCVSSLVATLANRPDDGPRLRSAAGADLADLCWHAIELAAPVPDYESAAREAGWEPDPSRPQVRRKCNLLDKAFLPARFYVANWQAACEYDGIEPHDREVYEHWAVSEWLADKLEAAGEKVDRDFADLCVWARTTTGQAIYADHVIEQIYAATHVPA